MSTLQKAPWSEAWRFWSKTGLQAAKSGAFSHPECPEHASLGRKIGVLGRGQGHQRCGKGPFTLSIKE